jgi:copper chaperone CopZ
MKKELILLLTFFLVLSLTPGVVLADHPEVDESPECPQNCCLALTPSCLACSECVSVEEFCLENPGKFGCEDEVEEIEVEVEIEDGIAEVEVEFSGGEFEFSLNTTDKETIISEIMTRTGLSDEEVRNNIEFEIDGIDEDTEGEIEIMHHKHGKKIRLLQLRAKITHAILRGQVVIDYLSEKDVSQDLILELQGILAELEILKEEIKEIPESDTKEEAITKFIDIKKESRDLVKQFRKKVWEITTEDERKEIKDRLHEKREEHKDKIKDIRSELKKLRHLLHSDEVKRLLKHLDVEDKRLIEAILSGSLTVDEIKTKLREHYNSLSDDQKRHSKARLRLKHANDKKEIRIKIDKYKDGQIKRIRLRIDERADKLEEGGHLNASKRLRIIASDLENNKKITPYNRLKI